VLDVTGKEPRPEDGHIEDDVPDAPPLPPPHPVIETPSPYGSTIEGESLIPMNAGLTKLPFHDGLPV
jgi:hypothetical protein